jgi:hypothetical protein
MCGDLAPFFGSRIMTALQDYQDVVDDEGGVAWDARL